MANEAELSLLNTLNHHFHSQTFIQIERPCSLGAFPAQQCRFEAKSLAGLPSAVAAVLGVPWTWVTWTAPMGKIGAYELVLTRNIGRPGRQETLDEKKIGPKNGTSWRFLRGPKC